MKLKKLILENFRGYKEKTTISFESITALIGKNDAGKSTVLEAMDIFFNDGSGVVKAEKGDCNVESGVDEFKIGIVFNELPKNIIIDTSYSTNLKEEYLLNEDNDFEVIKTYKSGKVTSVEIKCQYPDDVNVSCLHSKKIKELQKIVKDNDIEVEDNRKAALLRKAIFENFAPYNLQKTYINIKQEGAKQIWESIQKYMPIFSLFQSDRKNQDKDSEIQDPMKAAIKEVLNKDNILETLNNVFKEVEDATTKLAKLTIEKLSDMNPEIAKELKPEFQKPSWDKVFSCGLDSDLNIPLNKRGSGVRRLVLLNFFRAKVEMDKNESGNSNIIYAFEEPETALHPNHQKMLINSFIELSKKSNTQVIFTTHSPEIAKMMDIKSLRLIDKENVGNDILQPDNNILDKIVKTLGVFPTLDAIDNKVKVAICVEGKNDIDFLKNINTIAELKEIADLESDEFILLPLGGSTLKFWVNDSYLNKLNLAQVHIYDSDRGSKKEHNYSDYVNIINEKSRAKAFETKYREMENYVSYDVIRRESELEDFTFTGDYWETVSVPEVVAKFIHEKSESTKSWDELTNEKRKKKISSAKAKINKEIASLIKKEDLINLGAYEEVESWFLAIKSLL